MKESKNTRYANYIQIKGVRSIIRTLKQKIKMSQGLPNSLYYRFWLAYFFLKKAKFNTSKTLKITKSQNLVTFNYWEEINE